jgi:hypothetical protein
MLDLWLSRHAKVSFFIAAALYVAGGDEKRAALLPTHPAAKLPVTFLVEENNPLRSKTARGVRDTQKIVDCEAQEIWAGLSDYLERKF